MKKHSWKKIGCLFLAMLMMATMLATGVVAYENVQDDDQLTGTGSITITKLERKESTGYPDPALKNDGTKIGNIDAGTGLNGVTFAIYKVEADYEISTDFDKDAFMKEHTPVKTGTTETFNGQDGVLVFDELELYQRYLILETDAPAWVTSETAPFCVDLPMTNPDGNGWMKDIYVYPKNHTTRGTVELTKVGENNEKLSGAIFGLYEAKKEDDKNYTLVTDGNGNPILVTNLVTPATLSNDAAFSGNGYAMSDANGLVKFTNIPVGDYALIEVKAPANHALDKTPHFFTIEKGKTDDVIYKTMTNYSTLSKGSITKAVTAVPSSTQHEWTVTTKLPANIATYQSYKITDPVPAQVTLDADSIAVSATKTDSDARPLTLGIDYTLTIDENNTNLFIVALTKTGMEKVTGYENLQITFNSTVNEGAPLGPVSNTATLNAVAEEGEPFADWVTVTTNIYGINIKKMNFGKDSALKGAYFNVYTSEADAQTAIETIKNGSAEEIAALKNDDKALYRGSTGEDGTLLLSAMNQGTYYLVEVEAPAGYKIMNRVVEVTIGDNTNNTEFIESVTILNTKLVSLPITGGIGTLIFTFSGIALMGAAVLLYIRSRRKSSAQA